MANSAVTYKSPFTRIPQSPDAPPPHPRDRGNGAALTPPPRLPAPASPPLHGAAGPATPGSPLPPVAAAAASPDPPRVGRGRPNAASRNPERPTPRPQVRLGRDGQPFIGAADLLADRLAVIEEPTTSVAPQGPGNGVRQAELIRDG